MKSNYKAIWLGAAIALGGALPVILYWLFSPFPAAATPEMRPMPLWQQWLVVITAFGIKPLYLAISMILVVQLWRQNQPDLTALRRGLLIFWFGEIACAINYLVFGGHDNLWEFLHDYGMAVAFSFITYALFEGIDLRILRYSVPTERCAMLKLCRECIKCSEVPCKFRRVFAMTIPAAIAVAIMPFCATPSLVSYNSVVIGSVVNYSHPITCQLFETRYCAAVAVVLLSLSWAVLLFKRDNPVPTAKILFAAAMGPMSFGLMRLFLYSAYNQRLVWFEAWEEFTELLFVSAVACVLWIFRRALFQKPKQDSAEELGGQIEHH